jgi:hypothetical protein
LKKKLGPSGFAIMTFFGATNLYKKGDVAQHFFFEDLVFQLSYIQRLAMPFVKIFGYKG